MHTQFYLYKQRDCVPRIELVILGQLYRCGKSALENCSQVSTNLPNSRLFRDRHFLILFKIGNENFENVKKNKNSTNQAYVAVIYFEINLELLKKHLPMGSFFETCMNSRSERETQEDLKQGGIKRKREILAYLHSLSRRK